MLLQHVVDALAIGSIFALLALGIALIFGVMGFVNFAHGILITSAAYALVYLVPETPWPVWAVAMPAILVVLALAMERVAFRPVRGADPSTMLITSFAVAFVLQHFIILTIGAFPRTVALPGFLIERFELLGTQVQKLDVLTMVGAVLMFVGLAAFLRRTTLGIHMRAAAEDFKMAEVLGVRANVVIATAFALSAVFAAAAAFVLLAKGGTAYPTMGTVPVLYAFTATIMGGMGSMTGAVLGGYLLGFLSVGVQVILPPSVTVYRDAIVFTVVIMILVLRPQGLLVVAHRQERV